MGYMELYDENGDTDVLEAALKRDLFTNVARWGGCSFEKYKGWFHDRKDIIKADDCPYNKFGRIVEVIHDDNEDGDENLENISLANKLRQLGPPVQFVGREDFKHMVLEVN